MENFLKRGSEIFENYIFKRGFLLCLIFGFAIRLIPEAFSYPYPIGFDTIYYGARIKGGVVWNHWVDLFSTWMLYALLIPVYNVLGCDPFLFLKFVAPALYAVNACGVYYFAKHALNWSEGRALIAAFLFMFQIATLRLSWDLYRNMLGMAVLLFTLPWIHKLDAKKNSLLFVVLSILIVFSHEYASVIMFSVILGLILKDVFTGLGRRAFKTFLNILPASAIFLTRIYLNLYPIPFHVESNIISAVQSSLRPSGLFFLINYLNIFDRVQQYLTYSNLISHVLSLFFVLYLLLLPLVFLGFFRDRILDSWLILLLVGSFSSLIIPCCALDLWDRWMFMLVYPFTFYAARGIGRVWKHREVGCIINKIFEKENLVKGVVLGILFTTIFMGIVYMVIPEENSFFSNSNINWYLPSTMLHNTVPLSDVEGVINSLNWLNENMVSGSCVLIHNALLSWARINLENSHLIIHYVDVEWALDVISEYKFDPIYLVWWSDDIGWHGFRVPEYFTAVFNSGRFSVFTYDLI